MNILQIATLNRPIKGNLNYGPIESVIYNIDKGLHRLGQRSIVACSGDSRVFGEQYTTIDKSFSEYWSRNTHEQKESMKKHLFMALYRVKKGDIDIIHMHDPVMVEYVFRSVIKSPVPIVMTLHVPAEETGAFSRWNKTLIAKSDVYFVPISEYQAKQHDGLANLQRVIHHGIDTRDYPTGKQFECPDYLFSIGRITKDKGQDKAIEVARQCGLKLIIAGNVQNKSEDRTFFNKLKKSVDLIVDTKKRCEDSDYYERVIRPALESDKQVVYIGEVDNIQKKMWYRHALATLFPIQWGEPFGLVLIESLACGTPVIAFRNGSVPEIVIHGKTGFIVDTVEEMANSVKLVKRILPSVCRKHVENRFSIDGMVVKYLELYQWILEDKAHA